MTPVYRSDFSQIRRENGNRKCQHIRGNLGLAVVQHTSIVVSARYQYRAAGLILVLTLLSCHSDRGSTPDGTFAEARDVLDRIAESNTSGVPNAVLNATRCIVVVSGENNNGIASCLESLNRWTVPAVIAFTGARRNGDALLLFVLGQKEATALRSGTLMLQGDRSVAPGPTIRTKPILTGGDLEVGTLGYAYRGGTLEGRSVTGKIAAVPRAASTSGKSDQQVELQRSLASFFNVIQPTGIIIHHTAILPTNEKLPADKREVDTYHAAKGFDATCFGREYHVAYHYLVLQDGQVQAGRPERCQGAHAAGYNSFLGISVVGDFSSKDNPNGSKGVTSPTSKQEEALVNLCRRLRKQYDLPLHRVMRHSDVAATECPGDRFPFPRILSEVGH